MRSAVSADAEQHISQVFDRVDVVGFAGGDQRIETGDVFSGVFVPDEEEVFATEGDDTEICFGAIVVGWHARAIEKDRELGPLPECVADGDAELALRRAPPDFGVAASGSVISNVDGSVAIDITASIAASALIHVPIVYTRFHSYPFGQPRPDRAWAAGVQRLSDEQLSERKRGERDGEGSLRAAA